MTKKIINDRGPEKQNHDKPEKPSVLIGEPPEKNISQDYKQKTDINKQSKQAGHQQLVELTQFRDGRQDAQKTGGKEDRQARIDFFKDVHCGSDVFDCIWSVMRWGP
jgi:hypothetical protein